jgi:hypothetical protein
MPKVCNEQNKNYCFLLLYCLFSLLDSLNEMQGSWLIREVKLLKSLTPGYSAYLCILLPDTYIHPSLPI